MGCSGSCCEYFALPHSKYEIKRYAQQGHHFNGSLKETQLISGMLISLDSGKPFLDTDKVRRFWYSCKHWDRDTKKCLIYFRRPVMCRTYPDDTGKRAWCRNGCNVEIGTPKEQAIQEFKQAWGIKD